MASHFIDQYLSNLNQLAVTVLLVYYGLYILQTIIQYVGNLLFARVSYSIVRDIRRDAFANMEKLGMSYFDKTPAGSIVSRLQMTLRPLVICSQGSYLASSRQSLYS